ncbi:MAG: outer membrane beta-barrel protein [Ignavibacteriae bacterium]|nr:outer membrane beta-barrel protein [Ignavibacteria bacterium]MBI3364408.1 outer membrane beta-barrel protein [Ignavibacteriota bacterium]
MKYALWISCCCLVIVVTSISQTLQDNTTEVSLGAGISIPYLPNDSKEYWKNGWNAGLGYGYSLPQGKLGTSAVFFSIDYHRFALNKAKLLNAIPGATDAVASGPTSILTIMMNFRGTFLSISRTIQPYFIVGLGYMHVSQGDITVAGVSSSTIGGVTKNGFAWTAGVGFNIPINETVAFFVQGRSLLGVMDPTRQLFPMSAGIRYQY